MANSWTILLSTIIIAGYAKQKWCQRYYKAHYIFHMKKIKKWTILVSAMLTRSDTKTTTTQSTIYSLYIRSKQTQWLTHGYISVSYAYEMWRQSYCKAKYYILNIRNKVTQWLTRGLYWCRHSNDTKVTSRQSLYTLNRKQSDPMANSWTISVSAILTRSDKTKHYMYIWNKVTQWLNHGLY